MVSASKKGIHATGNGWNPVRPLQYADAARKHALGRNPTQTGINEQLLSFDSALRFGRVLVNLSRKMNALPQTG